MGPKNYLFDLWLKVEFLFCPQNALSQVLKTSASLFGCTTEVDYVIQMRFSLACFWNIFVQLLDDLVVAKYRQDLFKRSLFLLKFIFVLVFLFQKLLLVR